MFDKAYKILAIDDAKDGLLLLAFDLQEAGCEVVCANSGESALLLLEQNQVDLIILDMHMPGLSGLATLAALKDDSKLQEIPVIMLSASDLEDEIVAALELGADDYVVKPYIRKVLLARMQTALRLKEKTQALAYLAKTDFLTEINNRASFYQLTNNAMNQVLRNGDNLVIAMFDIDLFKRVNDNYGHDVGDQILKAFAQCMTQCFRNYDIIGRLGGEEFAVCLPHTSIDNAMLVCERLRENVECMRVPLADNSNKEVSVTVSIGVASTMNNSLDLACLLKQADIGLYHAKSHGRNQVVNADELQENDTVIIDNSSECSIENENSIDKKEELKENVKEEGFTIKGIDVNLGMGNVLGDENLYKEILKMFYQDHLNDAEKLTIAVENNDIKSSKHLAHTLKGVACSVGAMPLFEVTKLLDIAINEQQFDSLVPLLKDVVTELNLVMNDINEKLIDSTI